MKHLFFLLLFITVNISAQGLKFSSPEQLSQIDEYTIENRGYTDNLPLSFSLEKYVPPILKQQGGTCVGFSSVYYGMSILYNIKYNNTSVAEKFAYSFDPYFIYTLLNMGKNSCEDGLIMNKAFETLSKVGAKKMFFPQFLECDSKWDENKFNNTVKYTSPYRIKNYYFTDPSKSNFLDLVKKTIYYKNPVLIGALVTKSLSKSSYGDIGGVTSDGLWLPGENEVADSGHAMCVIGYDDHKYGGSFRLVNSWGSDFGDNGFLWIKYSDFKKYVKEAYIMDLPDNLEQENYTRTGLSDPRFKGQIYEGQIKDGYMNGYGIYDFGDDAFYIGQFNNGSKEGWFAYIDGNEEEFIKMLKFSNNKIIDSQKLGFTDKNDPVALEQAKQYFKIIQPGKKVIVVNEEPDIEIAKKIK